ncbi:MAG: hypothetical protein NTV68_00905 [Methanomicrobiales archaeon]|nr:hypothetical protein [Methanomicrobiales archaeon]
MDRRIRDEGEFSLVLGLLVVAILVGLIIFSLLIFPSFKGGTNIGTKLSNVPYPPIIAADVTGYADISGLVGNVMVKTMTPDPGKMGSVSLPITIQQFTEGAGGPPSIDMRKTHIWFTANGKQTELPLTETRPLTKPAWTIAGKSGVSAGYSANQDDFLEPNELFTLMIYPGNALPPGTPFSIDVGLAGQWPLTVNMTVPSPVKDAMDLGIPQNVAPK